MGRSFQGPPPAQGAVVFEKNTSRSRTVREQTRARNRPWDYGKPAPRRGPPRPAILGEGMGAPQRAHKLLTWTPFRANRRQGRHIIRCAELHRWERSRPAAVAEDAEASRGRRVRRPSGKASRSGPKNCAPFLAVNWACNFFVSGQRGTLFAGLRHAVLEQDGEVVQGLLSSGGSASSTSCDAS